LYTLTYKGKGFSLNDAYKIHWTQAKKKKDTIKMNFNLLLDNLSIPQLDTFKIEMKYWSRLDCDNTIPLLKCFVDVMRYRGIITDDTKTYYKGVSIEADSNLPSDTYQITVVPLSYKKKKKSRTSRSKKIKNFLKECDDE
jgi:hypothetical protein